MAAKKEVVDIIKLQVPAGKANPAPPVGPALGQKGVNIMEFCNQFNAIKFDFKPGTPIPVIIYVHKDKSFYFETKNPPTSYLIMQEISLKKGSTAPGKSTAGKITKAQIEEVAKKKKSDMNCQDMEACSKMVAGTAVSMGLEIVE